MQEWEAILQNRTANMRECDWDELRFILAVARQQSFAGAAKLLHVNESTVSRRIAKSEARLKAKLFERSDGRLFTTSAGLEMVRHAEKIELEVQAAEEAVSGTDIEIAGSVQITSVPIIVNRVLAPSLPELLRKHPHLHLDLIAEAAELSLIRREADIALRLARPHSELRALARRIVDIRYGVFLSRDLLHENAAWITYTEQMGFLPQNRWISEQTARNPSKLSNVRVNDAETLLKAIKAGFGKSFLPVFLAETEPNLIRIDDGSILWSRELWMMIHPEHRDIARIRTTTDWISKVIANRISGMNPQT